METTEKLKRIGIKGVTMMLTSLVFAMVKSVLIIKYPDLIKHNEVMNTIIMTVCGIGATTAIVSWIIAFIIVVDSLFRKD